MDKKESVQDQESYLREKKAREEMELLLQKKIQELHIAQTKLAAQEEELKKLTSYDSLTNLPNRNQFDEDLKREIARVKRYDRKLAVLYIDLDSFKKVNDNFGFEIGDLLLKEAANRLRHLLRTEDSAARLGADEFAVILAEVTSSHDAGIVAHRIVEKMAQPYRIGDHLIAASVSIGLACYPDAGDEASDLHKNANIALHSAKGLGRNNYQFFTIGLQEQHSHRLEIEAELHFAIERKEFFIEYQPRIDLQTNKMVGMEALLRWRHPERGVISPADFIPIAEETGLIIPIGEWVLKTACQQFAKWRETYHALTCEMAVNVSPRQFQNRNFIDVVRKALEENNIPPKLLELEITETGVVGVLGKIEEVLYQLRKMGVQFSIDDFGTGYSSLTRLRQLPIQSIKIDRSFVDNIDVRVTDNLIIKSTIDLAKDMGLNVVAEGVETESQLQFLVKNQCPQAQGYYYSKPLNTEQMEQFIKDDST